jgi:trimethylamine--corrinoid protein Co-methyltransferase
MTNALQAGITNFSGMGLQLFSDDDLYAIHCATLDVLQNSGIKVISAEAQEIFAAGGATLEPEKAIVKIPPHMVEDAIRNAPRTILLAGRNPKHDYVISNKSVAFTNFGEGIKVVDPLTRESHSSTKKDLMDATRICDALENITVYERALGADDVPGEVQSIHNAEAIFNNTEKHCFIGAGCGYNVKKIIEMASAIVGGEDNLRKRPIYTPLCCPNSPLSLNPDTTEIIIESARAGIPINVLSMALSGGTGPVTLAGTLVVHNAEVLSGLVLCQLVNKGNPFIYGSSTTMMDMRFTTAAVGAPELGMISAAVAKLAQYYLLPSFVAGG